MEQWPKALLKARDAAFIYDLIFTQTSGDFADRFNQLLPKLYHGVKCPFDKWPEARFEPKGRFVLELEASFLFDETRIQRLFKGSGSNQSSARNHAARQVFDALRLYQPRWIREVLSLCEHESENGDAEGYTPAHAVSAPISRRRAPASASPKRPKHINRPMDSPHEEDLFAIPGIKVEYKTTIKITLPDGRPFKRKTSYSRSAPQSARIAKNLAVDTLLWRVKRKLPYLDGIIPMEDIDWGARKEIGRGNGGQVHRHSVMPNKSGFTERYVAIKESNLPKESDLIDKLRVVTHENLVQYYGRCMYLDKQLIVMEYVRAENMYNQLREGTIKPFDDKRAISEILLGIVNGMEFLHSMRIVHRDLALRNVLARRDKAGWIIKICDIGLARQAVKGEVGYSYALDTSHDIPIWIQAPETLIEGEHSLAADVWMFATLVSDMDLLSSKGIIKHPANYEEAVHRAKMKKLHRDWTESTRDFRLIEQMQRCQAYESANRPTFTQLKESLTAIFRVSTLSSPAVSRASTPVSSTYGSVPRSSG